MCANGLINILVFMFLAIINHFTLASPSSDLDVYKVDPPPPPCSQLEYRCRNGDCIPSYSVCDGTKECADGSDETRAACTAVKIRCPALAFECAYGACIDKELKCDGKPDCADGSDEVCGRPSSRDCPSGKFQCSNGDCIDQYSVCDGTVDCSDQSDETKHICKDLDCPTNSFQCEYGACLEKSVRCNKLRECHDGSDEAGCFNITTGSNTNVPLPTEGGCILPKHPQNGYYVSTQCASGDPNPACRNNPGTPVPNNWLLKYKCNANFDISSQDSNEFSICNDGEWENPLDCIKLCNPLVAISMDIDCQYNGREVPCSKRMKPNTTARASCKQHYREIYQREYDSLVCHDNGEWSYRLFYCAAGSDTLPVIDCGVSVGVTSLILHGSPTHQGEFPWVAALYMKDKHDKWEQACGGTLITPHIVLTAAHCLVPENTNENTNHTEIKIIDHKNIRVGLGKYHRDYYKNEAFSIISEVRDIVVPRYYSGRPTHFALDIGLIDLVTSVLVTAYIMPACVHWDSIVTINTGTIGHVAGWGKTESGEASDVILSTNLTYVDNAECILRVKSVFKRLVTHDKFCAEENIGQVAKGDSGGGLTVVEKGQHFVVGVVSTKITQETAFSLFTNLANLEHRQWLQTEKTRLTKLHNET